MNLPSLCDTHMPVVDTGGMPGRFMRSPLPLSGLLDFDDPEPGVEYDDDEEIDDDDEYAH